jgi:O-antigen/teichoic acid export membrane protein
MDPALRRDALIYGLPLVVNGVGLLMVSQADKLLIGNLFGLGTLALYSLVVNLALLPLSPLGAVLQNLSIAFLAKRENGPGSVAGSFSVSWMVLVVASAYAVCVALLLQVLVPLLYGARYIVEPELQAAANLIAGIGLVIGYAFGRLVDNLPAVLLVAASCSLALPYEDGLMWKRGLILLLAMILIGLDLVVGLRSHIINQRSTRPASAA